MNFFDTVHGQDLMESISYSLKRIADAQEEALLPYPDLCGCCKNKNDKHQCAHCVPITDTNGPAALKTRASRFMMERGE